MTRQLNALLVEDCEDDALLVLRALSLGGFDVTSRRVYDRAALIAAMAQPWDVVLSDFSILGFSGMDALVLCRSMQGDVPFILVSGTVGEETAVALMKAGANDYVMKHNLSRLAPALWRELEDMEARATLRNTEQALIVSEKRFHAFMDAGPFAASIKDKDGHYLYKNKGWGQTFGTTSTDWIGEPGAISILDQQTEAVVRDQDVMASGQAHESVSSYYLPNAAASYRKNIRFPFTGTAGQGLLGEFSTDVTALKQSEETIRRLAFLDPLTDLPNRRLMQDRLGHALALAARGKRHCALLFLDLDDFKSLNDTHGHDAGDRVLKQVATRLSTGMRSQDTVARTGGDEFVIILEKLSADLDNARHEVDAIARNILAMIGEPYEYGDAAHRISASIGITLFCSADHSSDELMKRADIALYSAKAAGRNTHRIFDLAMHARITLRNAREETLRVAAERHYFILHYQPQVDSTGTLTGVEALLRMQYPGKELIMPDAFIGLAEESGLIIELGYWTLENACAQLTIWSTTAQNQHLTISVNVSARQFHDDDFVMRVLAIVARSSINPTRLVLELTESLLLDDVEKTIEKMLLLRSNGIKVSLDDFGIGFSSLSYLKKLPLYEIKIDREFVKNIIEDANDASIVSAIIGLANGFSLSVIAEGVETVAQLDLLKSRGCHRFQGYLFGRPVAPDMLDVASLVKQSFAPPLIELLAVTNIGNA